MEYLGIEIDLKRDELFDEYGLKRLRESYMREEETSPQQRLAFVASSFGSNKEHSQRLYDYASKHWLSFATPILSYGRSEKGLPISCYLSYVDDSSAGLVNTEAEFAWLSMFGGGVGTGFGNRSADEKSTGVLPHLKIYDAMTLAFRQGKTRRGSFAAYLDISHPDIIQFADIRKPTGDNNIRCLNIHNGINIPNAFMEIIERCMLDPDADDSWELVDPHSKVVVDTVSAKELWQKILELRMHTGEPYLHFTDTSNAALPDFLKARGLKIHGSNLCTEIFLPTSAERTAVCCLSSLNIEYFDFWKDNYQFYRDVAEMLDNVLTLFIEKAPDTISRARYSAQRERSIGIGALGFHAYLQKHNIPFESAMAKGRNLQIFRTIRENVDKANYELGAERGEAPDAEGTGRRFSLTGAVAPNASSSIVCGNTSASVEPFLANGYRQDTMSGIGFNKNKYLDCLIKAHVKSNPSLDYDQIWSSIISNGGSCRHLEFLTDWDKDVFKTAMEIDQRWIIEHAADRQRYIDQGQSINVFFRPDVAVEYLHVVHFLAWKKGLKSLYYCRSEKIAKADQLSKQIERNIIEELSNIEGMLDIDSCRACEG